jgi:hypothetical protein
MHWVQVRCATDGCNEFLGYKEIQPNESRDQKGECDKHRREREYNDHVVAGGNRWSFASRWEFERGRRRFR